MAFYRLTMSPGWQPVICSFVLIGRPEHFGSIMMSQSPVRLLNLYLKLRLFTQIRELEMVIGLSRVQLSLLQE